MKPMIRRPRKRKKRLTEIEQFEKRIAEDLLKPLKVSDKPDLSRAFEAYFRTKPCSVESMSNMLVEINNA